MLESIKNNKIIQKLLDDKLAKLIIYLGFAYIIWLRHAPLVYISDDFVVASMAGGYTLWDYLKYLFYFNGRVMTDLFANFWFRFDIIYWKWFDTIMYVLAAMLFTRIFTKNKWYHALVSCVLISFFPLFYLSSAGYVSTTTNYFYPVVCILLVLLPIKYMLEGKKIPILMYPITVVSIMYATNHDQSGIALLVGLLFFIGYSMKTKADKKLIRNSIIIFAFSAVMYVIYFFLPGHIGRMTGGSISELYWLPEFAEWSFWDKVYHGYSSTVSTLFYNDVFIFTIFTLLLLTASIRQKEPLKMFVGFVPFAGILISHYMGAAQYISYFPHTYGMTELMDFRWFILPFILSVVILISIFLAVWFNIKDEKNRLFVILLLLLAAGTRLMMGFTPTIYASSYRTFTFFLYALITCNLIILKDLEDDSEYKHLSYMGIGIIISLLTL